MQEKASSTAKTGTFLLTVVLLLLTVVASRGQATISIVVPQENRNDAGLILAVEDVQHALSGSIPSCLLLREFCRVGALSLRTKKW